LDVVGDHVNLAPLRGCYEPVRRMPDAC
jgi:hypothetical protein